MWQVVAGEDLKCNECRHEIPAKAWCISQMPPELPDGFIRSKFENFCVECKDCEAACGGHLIATFVPAMREVLTTGTHPRVADVLFQRSAPGVEMRFLKRRGPTFRSSTSGLTQKVRRKQDSADASDRFGSISSRRGHRVCSRSSDRPIGAISAPKHGGDSEQEA